MSIAPLSDRLLADRLRAFELRLAALERRVPSGDVIPFVPESLTNPLAILPSYTLDARYVRMNSLVVVMYDITFTSTGDVAWPVYSLNPDLPFTMSGVISGSWSAYPGTGATGDVWGPVTLFAGGDYALFGEVRSLGKQYRIDNRGLTSWDIASATNTFSPWTPSQANLRATVIGLVDDGV